jgi:hypothetical protein
MAIARALPTRGALARIVPRAHRYGEVWDVLHDMEDDERA